MAAEKSSSDLRKARLAQALKANIGRRKAQAREQKRALAQAGEAGAPAPEPPPDEDGCPN